MTSAFTTWSDFFAMGRYGFYVWLAVAMTLIPIVILVIDSAMRHRIILRNIARRRNRNRGRAEE
ncbi:heme exporter protein CcmD [Klebsiella sp. BIGb0407]|uniref:heme exporter protein CcmD n=1 Tax=Klebsiella sp. BIGb0407 TaxID=2940603 RepID=UPI002169DF8E|nr:heme exporter protein CcmD [Klebsiella sp. BIGb0407]MCS3434014.1 heme exporter protein D [Klebsiella sp. BIGb0407]